MPNDVSKKEIAISVKNVSKSFKLPHEQHNGVKQAILNIFKKNKKRGYEVQQVLKDVSFDVCKGDFFGIVGRNGSGKSTLLKLISEIYVPEEGSITVNGKLTPFIELGVGFNPELTGRENVYMNGALLGFSNKQMDEMYHEIVKFAELEKFMDQRLKNYSSGMQVRLAFSIAIRADTDILVLDEVLAVGDEAFQRKCFKYFAELKRNKKTVILVTHSMDSVQQYCNKAIMIETGKIVKSGKTNKVAQAYRELFIDDAIKEQKTKVQEVSNNKNFQAKVVYKNKTDKLMFEVSLLPRISINDVVITFIITRDNGEIIYRWTSDEKVKRRLNILKNKEASLIIGIDNVLPDGVFNVEVGIKSRDRAVTYALFPNAQQFEILNKGSYSNDVFWKPKETVELEV